MDHQKAWWNAPVGAFGCAATAPSRITASTAVPNEPPICCAVLVSALEWGICGLSRPMYAATITGDLVLAAIRHYGATNPVEVPDTGNLRDDLIALLNNTGAVRIGFVAAVTASFSGLLSDTGFTPAEVREKIMADRPLWSDQIFARAHQRGEIDLERIPPAVLPMPFDLMRHDMLMTYQQIPPERVLSIVDDLFMPLVGLSSSG